MFYFCTASIESPVFSAPPTGACWATNLDNRQGLGILRIKYEMLQSVQGTEQEAAITAIFIHDVGAGTM